MSGLDLPVAADSVARSPSSVDGPSRVIGDEDRSLSSPSPGRSRIFTRSRTDPIQATHGYDGAKRRVHEATEATKQAIPTVAHDVLSVGKDVLKLAPIPALEVAGSVLLSIWEAVQLIETNRAACLSLTERCAETLLSVCQEVQRAGAEVVAELDGPMKRLKRAFYEVCEFLTEQTRQNFLQRYLKRDEVHQKISRCESSIDDAMSMFSLKVQIRTLSLLQESESRRREDMELLCYSTTNHLVTSSETSRPDILGDALKDGELPDPVDVRILLSSYRSERDRRDRDADLADLRRLLDTALKTKSDISMMEVLQIGRDEMPDAIRILQSALGLEAGVDPARPCTRSTTATDENVPDLHSGMQSSQVDNDSQSQPESLDREFLTSSFNALIRLNRKVERNEPLWTIASDDIRPTKEISKNLWKGRHRRLAVTIKTFKRTIPVNTFIASVDVCMQLQHANIVQLIGGDYAKGKHPCFLVSPYYDRSDLASYLKSQGTAITRYVSARMMHEIAQGMTYLHDNHIMHGDLKASNVLLDKDRHCVVNIYGQRAFQARIVGKLPPPTLETLGWQSPEVMMETVSARITPEADIYAYGILCCEILSSGDRPWRSKSVDAIRHVVCVENGRPEIRPIFPSGHPIPDIIQTAWIRQPSLRPPFKKICEILGELHESELLEGFPTSSPSPSAAPPPFPTEFETWPIFIVIAGRILRWTDDNIISMISRSHAEQALCEVIRFFLCLFAH
ncbi:kinase-like protein [Peniophora sp. CONT]|nr:kinase-like protein [Peniophora sp. CONT]